MIESGHYPQGAEFDPSAPCNQNSNTPISIEVTVSVTLSKTMKIMINDYYNEVVKDEGGYTYTIPNTSECNLESAVKNQIELPQDKFKDWIVDDFVVIED